MNADHAGRLTADRTQPSAVAPQGIGHGRNPSRLSRRFAVAALALVGCAVATYLALYQVGALDTVWDPFFGTGSERVLASSLSRALPVPDAALGAGAYLIEAVAELTGSRHRWYRQSWTVLFVGVVAAGLAVTGVVLVVSQPVLTGTFCTLCLLSAGISFTIVALAAEEVRAAVVSFRSRP